MLSCGASFFPTGGARRDYSRVLGEARNTHGNHPAVPAEVTSVFAHIQTFLHVKYNAMDFIPFFILFFLQMQYLNVTFVKAYYTLSIVCGLFLFI